MKALAIDSSITQLTISVKNDDCCVTSIYNIGMKQSETLLPAIDELLRKTGITAEELDYSVLCQGPGSFTGLRLAFAAVKALELSNHTPVYGISTTFAYANPYLSLPGEVLSVVDAKKDKFYASSYINKELSIPEGDYELSQILDSLKENTVFVCGSDSKLFIEMASASKTEKKLIYIPFIQNVCQSLFEIAETKIANNEAPIKDFDGPVYIRASEAEIKLNEKN